MTQLNEQPHSAALTLVISNVTCSNYANLIPPKTIDTAIPKNLFKSWQLHNSMEHQMAWNELIVESVTESNPIPW